MLVDSNIVIYALDPADILCKPYLEREDALISVISRIEVLGFPGFAALALEKQEHLRLVVQSCQSGD